MTLGRTSAGKIKIKTDTPKGLRAVSCGCCSSCNGPTSGLNVFEITKEKYDIYRAGGVWTFSINYTHSEYYSGTYERAGGGGYPGGTYNWTHEESGSFNVALEARDMQAGCFRGGSVSPSFNRTNASHWPPEPDGTSSRDSTIVTSLFCRLGQSTVNGVAKYYIAIELNLVGYGFTGAQGPNWRSSPYTNEPANGGGTITATVDGNSIPMVSYWRRYTNFGAATTYSNTSTAYLTAVFAPCTILGCMDPCHSNYNPQACKDNGSCANDYANCPGGCTDPCSSNYDPNATRDDGSCTDIDNCLGYYGCTDFCSSNFNPDAWYDDGSCTYDDANCS